MELAIVAYQVTLPKVEYYFSNYVVVILIKDYQECGCLL